MPPERKALIRSAFAAAAGQYDAHAPVQRAVAEDLAAWADAARPAAPERILEIGCGTGLLTEELRRRWPQADLIATDLAPQMVDATARRCPGVETMVMDGEAPAFREAAFDLIVSSLTFQWFEDLPAALSRLHALLRPGSSLFFSTLGAESFSGWHRAYQQANITVGLPAYPDAGELRAMLSVIAPRTEVREDHYHLPSVGGLALMRHFRAIGAQVPHRGYRPLPPSALRRVVDHFDRSGGETLYHVLFGRIDNG
ncbi:biotin synthesis protein BioC [Sphingobium sp. SYK-6]|uniref:methyltransferase domain-containing protein n=1 Tax=Sphingobium sp. (strain NBRC 103272 / SYK-6) TaxID=627192 RepID=UPI000227749E|nr:methyltransferase domain-containing protein [Sphingobium sp. SYK-6]BAK67744.1 biotin synthesis protein BioC [Sphingobium sp. SYK-6]